MANRRQKRPDLVRVFTRFLLIDAFLSSIGRMMLEEFFIESLTQIDICGNAFDDEHWSSINPGYAAMTSARWESKFKHLFQSSDSCNMAVVALHCTAIIAIMLSAAAQLCLASILHRYSVQLEMSKYRRLRSNDTVEKALVRGVSFDGVDRKD